MNDPLFSQSLSDSAREKEIAANQKFLDLIASWLAKANGHQRQGIGEKRDLAKAADALATAKTLRECSFQLKSILHSTTPQ